MDCVMPSLESSPSQKTDEIHASQAVSLLAFTPTGLIIINWMHGQINFYTAVNTEQILFINDRERLFQKDDYFKGRNFRDFLDFGHFSRNFLPSKKFYQNFAKNT